MTLSLTRNMTELELIIKIGGKELRLTEAEAKELYGKLNGLFYQKQTEQLPLGVWPRRYEDILGSPSCFTDGGRVGSPVKTSGVSVNIGKPRSESICISECHSYS